VYKIVRQTDFVRTEFGKLCVLLTLSEKNIFGWAVQVHW